MSEVGPPFPFLALPAELRVKIYRYCLIAYKPIHPFPPERDPHINCPSKFATGLLGVCGQINSEAAQVLYGENEFRFQKSYGHISLLHFLKHIGRQHREWLARVTMTTPFMGKQVYEHGSGWRLARSWDAHLYPSPGALRIKWLSWYYYKFYEYLIEGKTWGSLCEELMQRLAKLPRLKVLAVVLPQKWKYRRNIKNPKGWSKNRVPVAMKHARVWDALRNFCSARPFVKVVVLGSVEEGAPLTQGQARHMKNWKRELGVWGHRVICPDEDMGWEFPDKVDEDPDEWLKDLRMLFG